MAFDDVFAELRAVMAEHASELVVKFDGPGGYQLAAPRPLYPKKPNSGWFGGVRTGKRYVSYHLMPIYVDQALLGSISPSLKKRMQGKSCFNFTRIDDATKAELTELTRRAVEVYRSMGMV